MAREEPGHHHCFPSGPDGTPTVSKGWINSLAALSLPHAVQQPRRERQPLASSSTEGKVLLCWVKVLRAPFWAPRTGRFLEAKHL